MIKTYPRKFKTNKARKSEESSLVTSICAELQLYENQKKLIFIRMNTGAIKTGTRFFRFGKKGSADILIFSKLNKVTWIECKTEKGKQQESQKEFELASKEMGHSYYIVRNHKDFDAIIKDILCNH